MGMGKLPKLGPGLPGPQNRLGIRMPPYNYKVIVPPPTPTTLVYLNNHIWHKNSILNSQNK